MARRKKQRSTVYIVSVAAHLAVGAILALVPQEKLREVVAIALNETKEEKKPEPPKPPEHPAERAVHAPGHNYRPAAAAPVAAAAMDPNAFADIGVALDSSSEDGVAVNIAPPVVAAPVAVALPQKPKVLVGRHNSVEDAPVGELVKAHPLPGSIVRPSYTEEARRAHVEGRVRMELMVDENGDVTSARILQGLGYGLDEVALAAAERMHFSPATRGGRPVANQFILAMVFRLPT